MILFRLSARTMREKQVWSMPYSFFWSVIAGRWILALTMNLRHWNSTSPVRVLSFCSKHNWKAGLRFLGVLEKVLPMNISTLPIWDRWWSTSSAVKMDRWFRNRICVDIWAITGEWFTISRVQMTFSMRSTARVRVNLRQILTFDSTNSILPIWNRCFKESWWERFGLINFRRKMWKSFYFRFSLLNTALRLTFTRFGTVPLTK